MSDYPTLRILIFDDDPETTWTWQTGFGEKDAFIGGATGEFLPQPGEGDIEALQRLMQANYLADEDQKWRMEVMFLEGDRVLAALYGLWTFEQGFEWTSASHDNFDAVIDQEEC